MADDAILVTGAAGFIGFHVARRLLQDGRNVVGLDNMNDYYDPKLKEARLAELAKLPEFHFRQAGSGRTATAMAELFAKHKFPQVVHLAAQAGVRYSLANPHAYVDANLQGFVNVLEGCRHNGCQHLRLCVVVIGLWREHQAAVLGASTMSIIRSAFTPRRKKANELMAHTYSHLFRLPATGLRFFTVYGPWGRPDMAMFMFATAIVEGKPLRLFNNGNMRRDFTFVDDVTESVVRLVDHVPAPNPAWSGDAPDPATSNAPWRVYNIGNNTTVEVSYVVELLEKEFGRPAIKEMAPMQPGDVSETRADVDDLMRDVGFRPSTTIEDGIKRFADWYRIYRGN